jgi:alanine dehydrogenase
MLHISESDAFELYSMDEALAVVEAATREYGLGDATMPSKIYLEIPGQTGDFRAMPAYSKQLNVAGVKWVNSHPDNQHLNLPTVRAWILLNDPATAAPLALIDGTRITSMRTGAVGGIAAKYLSRPHSHRVGFVGAGVQAYYQAMAICKVRPVTEIRIYDLSRESQLRFSRQIREFFNGKLVECDTVSACIKDVDIVVTSTPSRSPLVELAWVAPGTHINAIGADAPGKQELDPMILVKGRIVVDDVAQASHSGEINVPLHNKVLSKHKVQLSIADVVSGQKKGRLSRNQITIFDSTGLGIHDIASAGYIFRKALGNQIGTQIVD